MASFLREQNVPLQCSECERSLRPYEYSNNQLANQLAKKKARCKDCVGKNITITCTFQVIHLVPVRYIYIHTTARTCTKFSTAVHVVPVNMNSDNHKFRVLN